jgi:hypothetical protein
MCPQSQVRSAPRKKSYTYRITFRDIVPVSAAESVFGATYRVLSDTQQKTSVCSGPAVDILYVLTCQD